MNKKLVTDLMQAVAAGSITITQNPNISNESIGEVVMLGLRIMGYTTFSDEEIHLIADACTIISTTRDTYKQMHPEVVENDEKESETIEVICKRNEYAS